MAMEKNITPDTVISALASYTSATASDFPIDVFPAKLQCLRLSQLQSEIPIAWK